jgi:AcrR family transcriptional regulator
MPRQLLTPSARREQLLNAAAQVFARKGYQRASVSDIIETAGCARGTFYLHFEGKEAAFIALVDSWFAEIDQRMQAPPEAPTTAAEAARQMRADLRKWFGFVQERRHLTRVVLREAGSIDPAVAERVERLTRRSDESRRGFLLILRELGLIRPDLDLDVLNACLGGMFREVTLTFAAAEEPPEIEWLVEQVQSLVETGIYTPAAG